MFSALSYHSSEPASGQWRNGALLGSRRIFLVEIETNFPDSRPRQDALHSLATEDVEVKLVRSPLKRSTVHETRQFEYPALVPSGVRDSAAPCLG